MTRRVRWARAALDDLKQQVDYIAADNPIAARVVRDRIDRTARRLGEIATGRPGRVTGTYEKPVVGLPYIIAYSVIGDRSRGSIVILRVIHGARRWEEGEWPID